MDVLEHAGQITWYHAMELEPGRKTEAMFDLDPFVHRYGLPERLDGMRCLDVGTWDGYWAFEMERRAPPRSSPRPGRRARAGLAPAAAPRHVPERPAARASGSRASCSTRRSSASSARSTTRRPRSSGTFDLVFCGSVLIHLRDQLLALERIAGLFAAARSSAEAYDRLTSLLPIAVSRYRADVEEDVVFWRPNLRTWTDAVDRGLRPGRAPRDVQAEGAAGWSVPHVVHHAHTSDGCPWTQEPPLSRSASPGRPSLDEVRRFMRRPGAGRARLARRPRRLLGRVHRAPGHGPAPGVHVPRRRPPARRPPTDNLLVFVGSVEARDGLVAQLAGMGVHHVPPENPYWERSPR